MVRPFRDKRVTKTSDKLLENSLCSVTFILINLIQSWREWVVGDRSVLGNKYSWNSGAH